MLIIGYSRAPGGAPGGAAGGATVVRSAAYSDQAYSASMTLAIPPGVGSGNTLVAMLRTGIRRTVTAPPGWTLVAEDNSLKNFQIYRKLANGTEGGTTVVWTANLAVKVAFGFWEVAGNRTVQATIAPVSATPPPHAPSGGGSAPTAWLVVSSSERASHTVSAGPAGYSGFAQAKSQPTNSTSGGEVTLGIAQKESTAASEAPGPFAWTATNGAQAATISVR
jgi:hypothetical protein